MTTVTFFESEFGGGPRIPCQCEAEEDLCSSCLKAEEKVLQLLKGAWDNASQVVSHDL